MLIVPHTVRVSNLSRFTLARSLSVSVSVSRSLFAPTSPFFHLSFRSPISPPHMTFLLSSDNFSALPLCISAIQFYQGSLSSLLLQIEAATLQKTTAPLGKNPPKKQKTTNFRLHTTQMVFVINKNVIITSAHVYLQKKRK